MESKRHICIAICERNIKGLESASTRASEVGGLVELRLDCLDEDQFNAGSEQLARLLHNLPVPTILTYRAAEQGGSSNANFEARFAFWNQQGLSLPSHLSDWELDVTEQFARASESGSTQVDWSRIICSHHDFLSVPANLTQIYETLSATPARILKIAVQANDITDCLPVFHILKRALEDGREMIAIAMGTAGLATRILGPSRGGFLTYAALEGETGTAPGQLSASELRSVYRIEKIDRQTQIFGLMGLPISHSISPWMHNAAFEASGMNAVYLPFEVKDVKGFMRRMIHPRTRELDWNFVGLSVTAPHKSAVMDELDWIDPVAKTIGAVNTILIEDGRLQGYNTDARGLITPLIEKFGELQGARCAVLGAGGAARAALWGLSQEGAELTVFSRNTKKTEVLAEEFGAALETMGDVSFDRFEVVINTTPLGTAGEFESGSPATSQQLRGARLAYDLVYNPTETQFLRAAREAGCQTLGGLSMLIAQAAEQFRLWTGKAAPEGVMQEAAERALQHAI